MKAHPFQLQEDSAMPSYRRIFATILFLALLCPMTATAWQRGNVESFATLPAGSANPEGITVDATGNVYVTEFNPTAPAGQAGRIVVFGPNGHLLRRISVTGSSAALLGLAFHPQTGALLVLDFGASKVLN